MGVANNDMRAPHSVLARATAFFQAFRTAVALLPSERSGQAIDATTNQEALSPILPVDIPQTVIDGYNRIVDYLVNDSAVASHGTENFDEADGSVRTRVRILYLRSLFAGTAWRQLRVLGASRGIVEALMGLLRLSADFGPETMTSKQNLLVITTLANFVFETEGKNRFAQHPSMETLVSAALSNVNDAIVSEMARAVFSGSTMHEHKRRFACAIPHLVRHIHNPNQALAVNAIGALANITIHPECKPLIVEAGALALLYASVNDLDSSPGVIHHTMRVLFSLAALPTIRPEMIRTGALQIIRDVVTRRPIDQRCIPRISAMGWYANLTTTETAARDADYAASVIVPTLASNDPDLLTQTVRAMDNISHLPDTRRVLCTPETLQRLTEVLKTLAGGPPMPVTALCGGLTNLVIGDQASKNVVVNAGGFDAVLAVLRRPHPPIGTKAEDLKTFNTMMSQATRLSFSLVSLDESKRAFAEAGGAEALLRVVNCDAVCAENAMGALANMSTVCPERIIRARAFPVMFRCMINGASNGAKAQAFRGVPHLLDHCRRVLEANERGRIAARARRDDISSAEDNVKRRRV